MNKREDPPPYPGGPMGNSAGGFVVPQCSQQQPQNPPGYPPMHQQNQPHVMGGQQAFLHNVVAGGYDSDIEGGGRGGGGGGGMSSSQGFDDKEIRRGFIRKVYGILSMQLIVTMAIIALFVFVDSVKVFTRRHSYLYWVAFALLIVCLIAMACCEGVRRKSPTNYIFLSIFTLCEGFMLGTVTAYFDVEAVIMAVGICAAVTFALSIFAFQTKIDFTTCGGMLCAMLVILMISGFLVPFFPGKITMILYGAGGALVFSLYLVYDTQMMMGGNHKYSVSPEEYIFAALSLYLDIVNLFLYILTIVGAARSD